MYLFMVCRLPFVGPEEVIGNCVCSATDKVKRSGIEFKHHKGTENLTLSDL
jgi:hypothetical protein